MCANIIIAYTTLFFKTVAVLYSVMHHLLKEIRTCTVCSAYLPNAPKPILQASPKSTIMIIGQAPGLKVQQTGTPWDDKSGDELRRWLGVSKEQFYNDELFALVPMGFCYPGKGTSGDLPPRKECAPLWHEKLLNEMQHIQLTILIGLYAQQYYLNDGADSVTKNVADFERFLPKYLPLVHPSPRNNIWQKKNPWFEETVVPKLQTIVHGLLR